MNAFALSKLKSQCGNKQLYGCFQNHMSRQGPAIDIRGARDNVDNNI